MHSQEFIDDKDMNCNKRIHTDIKIEDDLQDIVSNENADIKLEDDLQDVVSNDNADIKAEDDLQDVVSNENADIKLEDDLQNAVSNDNANYDPHYDEEVNRLLDEVKEELLSEYSETRQEKCDPPEAIPPGYQKMLDDKIEVAQSRLKCLSELVCEAHPSAKFHIQRIEQDHNTTFCKMDYPRHPPWDKPWMTHWIFNCRITCNETDKENHVHVADCQGILLEHDQTKVSTATPNVLQVEYPQAVMDVLHLFQDFAIQTTKYSPTSHSEVTFNTVFDKNMWTSIKLTVRSNNLKELMIVVHGLKIASLVPHFKKFIESNPQRIPNVVSLVFVDQSCSYKKMNDGKPPELLIGRYVMRDTVGPITMIYDCTRPNYAFNSAETIQLNQIIQDYTVLTNETTLLDIGFNFGVSSLMMSYKCERVVGLSTVKREISLANGIKVPNKRRNVSFMKCDPENVFTVCSPFAEQCPTVAVLNLSSPYGKSNQVMQALRKIPSIWRVIVYGSFAEEFHECITILTMRAKKKKNMGEYYLPMQGCILDKSPSNKDAFDIVIAFERKCEDAPKIALLAPGPTLNVKSGAPEWEPEIPPEYLHDNHELQDMDVSPDIHSMETPERSDIAVHSSSTAASANVTTADGFEFSVTVNNTYMGVVLGTKPAACELEGNGNLARDKEKKSKWPKIRVKSVDEITMETNRAEEDGDDLLHKPKILKRC